MNRKILCAIAAFSVLTASLVSAAPIKDGKLKAPGKGKVVITGKVVFKTPIDLDARRLSFTGKAEKKNADVQELTIEPVSGAKAFTNQNKNCGEGEYFYATAKVAKDGTVSLARFKGTMFSNNTFYFYIPAGTTITVPEGTEYIYVGTYQYDLDNALRVKGFKHIDELKEAQKEIIRAAGEDIELSRGVLKID